MDSFSGGSWVDFAITRSEKNNEERFRLATNADKQGSRQSEALSSFSQALTVQTLVRVILLGKTHKKSLSLYTNLLTHPHTKSTSPNRVSDRYQAS